MEAGTSQATAAPHFVASPPGRRKLPPYARQLGPSATVFVAVGPNAWRWAKQSAGQPVVVLPADEPPGFFNWRFCAGRGVFIAPVESVERGGDGWLTPTMRATIVPQNILDDLAAQLLAYGADPVLLLGAANGSIRYLAEGEDA